MRYRKFIIENFKGIKRTEVNLASLTGANVFALVGLNESGKTTILEAIHSFAPDYRSSDLTGAKTSTSDSEAESLVPRHQIAKFTGKISVTAEIETCRTELEELRDYIPKEIISGVALNIEEIPDVFELTRSHVFSKGDYVETIWETNFPLEVKTGRQRNWRPPSEKEKKYVLGAIRDFIPDIAYYPTFIFDFPKRIYLSYRLGEKRSNWFYRSVFEDILQYEGEDYSIQDIIRRVRAENYQISWADFFPKWMTGEDRGKVQHIIDRASATATKVVFGRWNRIFGEAIGGKEVVIDFDVEEGVKLDEAKNRIPDVSHNVYVRFQIKDGTRRFDVEDRSLGFRWFFAFLLFTQFRVSRKKRRAVMFLFDEPASNLHAAAQAKLIESFPEIARGENMLIYSTHSHYMIDPSWLEQTFIVTNRMETPSETIVSSAVLDDESLDIQAHRYREFVNNHPTDTSYFQPIIDRLEVVPSRFDYSLPSIVVEGKSDYYILGYAAKLLNRDALRLLPGLGAGTFNALISLSVGWGVKMLFVLDSDRAGKEALDKYAMEHGAKRDALFLLTDFDAKLREIEGLLDDKARAIIKESIGASNKLSKNQIRRFFQERLARNEVISLGDHFAKTSNALLDGMENALGAA